MKGASNRKTPLLSVVFLEEMAAVLRILAHGYRLRIVEQVDLHGPMPVHRLLAALGGAQGALSQHLTKLRLAGVLRADRRGKEVWCSLANPDALTLLNCLRKRAAIEGNRRTTGATRKRKS